MYRKIPPVPKTKKLPERFRSNNVISPILHHPPMHLDVDLSDANEHNPRNLADGPPSSTASTRSRSKAQSFVFVSDDILNEDHECKMQILEEDTATPVLPHSILQQLRSNDSHQLKIQTKNDVRNMDDATRHFYNFLKNHKLDKYFDKFKENECCDIRDIEYLIDVNFFKEVIGMKNPIHRKKLLALFEDLKHKMSDFKQFIAPVIYAKISQQGIVTMDILCSEVETRSDLTQKLHLYNEYQCELLWNIIDLQINPHVDGYSDGTHTDDSIKDPVPNIAEGLPTNYKNNSSSPILVPYDPNNNEFEVRQETTPTPGVMYSN